MNSNKAASQPKVNLIRQYAANGRCARMATQVTFPDGRRVTFLERLSKREAIKAAKQARYFRAGR